MVSVTGNCWKLGSLFALKSPVLGSEIGFQSVVLKKSHKKTLKKHSKISCFLSLFERFLSVFRVFFQAFLLVFSNKKSNLDIKCPSKFYFVNRFLFRIIICYLINHVNRTINQVLVSNQPIRSKCVL